MKNKRITLLLVAFFCAFNMPSFAQNEDSFNLAGVIESIINYQNQDEIISDIRLDSKENFLYATNKFIQGNVVVAYNEYYETIEALDKKYEQTSNNLKNIYYELQEVSRDINSYKNDSYFDVEERDYIEERLDLIYSLKRKYGNTIKEILKYKEEIITELKKINNLEEYNNKLKYEKQKMEEKLNLISIDMHKIRIENSKKLINDINTELQDLEMKNARINIKIEYHEKEFFENGKDKVEFYIITNAGEEEKELSKIASGGEMSRIMIAIKKVLAEYDNVSVLVFDEIDTGISGKAANSVAKKIKVISNKHQVLCISHLPNIAAMADYNYFISKNIIQDRTKTEIKLLEEKEVIEEIARISSGEINEITLKYAKELRSKKAS